VELETSRNSRQVHEKPMNPKFYKGPLKCFTKKSRGILSHINNEDNNLFLDQHTNPPM